jgi:hypothetical protein
MSQSVLGCLPLGLQLLKPWRMWLVQRSISQCVVHGMAHGIRREQCVTPDVTWVTKSQVLGSKTWIGEACRSCHVSSQEGRSRSCSDPRPHATKTQRKLNVPDISMLGSGCCISTLEMSKNCLCENAAIGQGNSAQWWCCYCNRTRCRGIR